MEFLLLRHVDAYLLGLDSLLIGRFKSKTLVPVLRDRLTHAKFLADLMNQLGLERREPKPVELGTYIEERYGEPAEE